MKRFAAVVGVYALVFGIGFAVCWLCEHRNNDKRDKQQPTQTTTGDWSKPVIVWREVDGKTHQQTFRPYAFFDGKNRERCGEMPANEQDRWAIDIKPLGVIVWASREEIQPPKPEVAPMPKPVEAKPTEKKSEAKPAVDPEKALVDFIKQKEAEIATAEAKVKEAKQAHNKHQEKAREVLGKDFPNAPDESKGIDLNSPYRKWEAENQRLYGKTLKAEGEVTRLQGERYKAVNELTKKVGIVRTRQLGFK